MKRPMNKRHFFFRDMRASPYQELEPCKPPIDVNDNPGGGPDDSC